MKIPYYFGMSILLLLANIPNSYSSYSDIHLIKQIKPYILAKSKPTYTKYAAVSFLKSDSTVEFKGTLDVKSQCASLGYIMPVDKCTSKKDKSGMTGKYVASRLCSEDSSMKNVAGADKYTTTCCDTRLYTVKENDECPNNAAKLSNDSCYWGGENKYRCACDRSRYQYSTITGEWCGTIKGTNIIDYTRFNANLACSAYEPKTQKNEYYFVSCCPASYSQCDSTKHQMGRGNECRVIGGGTLSNPTIISKFEECVCATHYDTICTDGKLIDVSNYCTLDNGVTKFTTETNCESDCTKTSETNIDDYLYGNVWHCLYELEGATLKQSNEELKGGLCNAPEGFSALLGVDTENVYDECHYQGYTKSEADCYDADTIIHCPTDPTKVWCMEGRYCTGYDVGAQACMQGNMINPGANIELCTSSTSDKGIRCRYKVNDCNIPWTEGTFDSTAFVNYDTSTKGDGEHCCKRGYVMNENGICIANTCDRTLYPYDQNPSNDPGTLEICYQADQKEALGYKAYFGYSSCNDDPAKGGMWMQKGPSGAESRQCVCARNGEGGRSYYLPFDLDSYFGVNEAKPYGFNKGYYGKTQTCTDTEGSYYGYTSCYLSEKLGTSSDTKGMCIYTSRSYDSDKHSYPYDTSNFEYVNHILETNGQPVIGIPNTVMNTNNGSYNKDNTYCINYNMHCKPNVEAGADAESDPVCKMTYSPENGKQCMSGIEEDCTDCYHIGNLKRDADGKPVLEDGKYVVAPNNLGLRIKTFQHSEYKNFGFDTCPSGYLGGFLSNTYGTCFKKCYTDNLKDCYYGDILTDPSNNVTIGIIYNKTSSQLYVYGKRTSKDYDNALTYISSYAPTGNTDPQFAAGQWHMPSYVEANTSNLPRFRQNTLYGPEKYIGYGHIGAFWVSGNDNEYYAHERTCCSTTGDEGLYPKTSSLGALPIIILSY